MQVEGRNPVVEYLHSDKYSYDKLFIQNEIRRDEKISRIIDLSKTKNIQVVEMSKKKLDKIAQTDSHQGVILSIKNLILDIENLFIENNKSNRKVIYIRDANHDHNIGAIIRTAEIAGFDAVILPPKKNLSPQVIRASMGATAHIDVFSYSLFPLIKKLNDEGWDVIGIERGENSQSIYSTDFINRNILLVIGGEDRGLSGEIQNKCDIIVDIPMKGKVNSLNMSVAAAIVMFEILRQQN